MARLRIRVRGTVRSMVRIATHRSVRIVPMIVEDDDSLEEGAEVADDGVDDEDINDDF